MAKKQLRWYGQWAGDPVGSPECLLHCVESVHPQNGWIPHQCTRNRGHGPNGEYCKQHAKKAAKRKRKANQ